MSDPQPPDFVDGLDHDAPNLRLLLHELRWHLHDVLEALGDESEQGLRNLALLHAVQRYRKAHFQEED